MSAGTQNLDLSALFNAERGKRPALTQTSVPKKPKLDRLRIVRDDDPASLIDDLSNCGEKSSRASLRLEADDLSEGRIIKPLGHKKEPEAEPLPPNEPGVDLSVLQPRDIDTAKMAAYVQNVSAMQKDHRKNSLPASPQKEIAMPMANTDLQEIFQKDKVCVISRRQADAPAVSSDIKNELTSPQTAYSPTLAVKTAPVPDKTLQYLTENWPQLPPNVQAAILNVVDAAVADDDD
jgi:hypothetical protein